MTVLRLSCSRCDSAVQVGAASALLRVVLSPACEGELMFACPRCGAADVQLVEGDVLTQLLVVGVQSLELIEPTLDAVDQAPPGPRFDRQDLLDWHELLEDVAFVVPWE